MVAPTILAPRHEHQSRSPVRKFGDNLESYLKHSLSIMGSRNDAPPITHLRMLICLRKWISPWETTK